jgi:hypothetical protein
MRRGYELLHGAANSAPRWTLLEFKTEIIKKLKKEKLCSIFAIALRLSTTIVKMTHGIHLNKRNDLVVSFADGKASGENHICGRQTND